MKTKMTRGETVKLTIVVALVFFTWGGLAIAQKADTEPEG